MKDWVQIISRYIDEEEEQQKGTLVEPWESLSVLGEELEGLSGVSLHGGLALGPVGRADLAVLVGELEGLDQAKDLLGVAADGEVVHGDLANDALGVDDEETTEGVARVHVKHTIVDGDLLVDVLDQRDVHLAETSVLAVGVDPGQVGEHRVHRDTKHLSVQLGELGSSLREGNNLSGAHKGEVQRIEEENNPLSLVVAQRHGRNALVGQDRIARERGRGVSNTGDSNVTARRGPQATEERKSKFVQSSPFSSPTPSPSPSTRNPSHTTSITTSFSNPNNPQKQTPRATHHVEHSKLPNQHNCHPQPHNATQQNSKHLSSAIHSTPLFHIIFILRVSKQGYTEASKVSATFLTLKNFLLRSIAPKTQLQDGK